MADLKDIQILVETAEIRSGKNLNKAFMCNELTITNQGSTTVMIDGSRILTPGQSFTYPARDPREVNKHTYFISFLPSDRVAGCDVVVTTKTITNLHQLHPLK